MKKVIVVCLAIFIHFNGLAQDQAAINKFIEAGIDLHDEGEYNAAIREYESALEMEKHNPYALAEIANSYLSLKDFDNCIKTCKAAIKNNPDSEALKHVYVYYGTALNQSEDASKAIKIYKKGISKFPDFYLLHFNQGIALVGLKKYDEALPCFEKSAFCNPQHGSSHNAVARICKMNKMKVASLLALSRFFVVEPEGQRTQMNFELMSEIMIGNVEKNDDKNFTIYIDPEALGDDKKKKANNFSSTNLLMALLGISGISELDSLSEVEIFQNHFETICSSLEETKEDNYGFYWEYYVPYFLEMKENNYLETFSYIVYLNTEQEDVMNWLKDNKEKIDAFYEWSGRYDWAMK